MKCLCRFCPPRDREQHSTNACPSPGETVLSLAVASASAHPTNTYQGSISKWSFSHVDVDAVDVDDGETGWSGIDNNCTLERIRIIFFKGYLSCCCYCSLSCLSPHKHKSCWVGIGKSFYSAMLLIAYFQRQSRRKIRGIEESNQLNWLIEWQQGVYWRLPMLLLILLLLLWLWWLCRGWGVTMENAVAHRIEHQGLQREVSRLHLQFLVNNYNSINAEECQIVS